MKRLFATTLIALTLIACGANLPQRYNYSPPNSDGIQCKASCSQMYESCSKRARDKCIPWGGAPCGERAAAIKDDMIRCIGDEKECLQVCERPE